MVTAVVEGWVTETAGGDGGGGTGGDGGGGGMGGDRCWWWWKLICSDVGVELREGVACMYQQEGCESKGEIRVRRLASVCAQEANNVIGYCWNLHVRKMLEITHVFA